MQRYVRKLTLGEFTMVSQPIRLVLVDWFSISFLGHLTFFFEVVFLLRSK